MKISTYADNLDKLEEQSGSNAKKRVIRDILKKNGDFDNEILCRLTLGELFDEPDRNTHVAGGTVFSVVSDMTGVSRDRMSEFEKDTGKVSLAVEKAFEEMGVADEKVISGSNGLAWLYAKIQMLPDADGDKHREKIVREMLDSCWTPKEAKWVSYALLTDLSIGCGWKTFAGAFSSVEEIDKKDIYKSRRILGTLSSTMRGYYKNESLVLTPTLGEPFAPMLAQAGQPVSAYKGTDKVAQTKYDGARLLIHNQEGEVKMFSRNFHERSHALPEVTSLFEDDDRELLLDTEVVAFDPNTGEVQEFNKILQRFNREKNINEAQSEVEVHVFIFDCLYNDGWIIEEGFLDRFHQIPSDLEKFDNVHIADIKTDVEEAYQTALANGHEGVIVKTPNAPFVFHRSVDWQKIKPTETLDLKVSRSLAGRGDRAGKLGAVVLETSDGVKLGNVGGGFNDKQLEKWKDGQLDGKIVEVMAEELSDTDKGYALRFPRFERVRENKDEADSLERVEELLTFN